MANRNSNASQHDDATPLPPVAVCHQRFTWLDASLKHNGEARFAETVVNVSRGASVIVSILAAHILDLNACADGGRDSTRFLLNGNDTDALAQLAVFSLDQLDELANLRVEHFNDQAHREAQA